MTRNHQSAPSSHPPSAFPASISSTRGQEQPSMPSRAFPPQATWTRYTLAEFCPSPADIARNPVLYKAPAWRPPAPGEKKRIPSLTTLLPKDNPGSLYYQGWQHTSSANNTHQQVQSGPPRPLTASELKRQVEKEYGTDEQNQAESEAKIKNVEARVNANRKAKQ